MEKIKVEVGYTEFEFSDIEKATNFAREARKALKPSEYDSRRDRNITLTVEFINEQEVEEEDEADE